MGKAKKNKEKYYLRHDPLDQQILEDRNVQSASRQKIRGKDLKDDEFVDNKLTTEILKQAIQQQEDVKKEMKSKSDGNAPHPFLSLSDNEASEDEDFPFQTEETEVEIPMIDEDDEKALKIFMGNDAEKRATFADIIKEKLTEMQTEIYTLCSDTASGCNGQIDNKDWLRLKELVPVLSSYRSGKLPKAFKAIPRFSNWQEIVYITEPDKWSAATMYQATRMFSSNLQDKMAQRFYNLFLLPRLRDDIAECKTLNTHLYQALGKALFKPAAFFKGIIIPLCKSGNCTLREATIFGSVLLKYSIPVLHSSAALLTIAEMDYSGVNSIFMRTLLEKKYALPYRVVDALVDHFLRFASEEYYNEELPLLWHQCLLTFVQTYKADLSAEQRHNLLKLLTIHSHKKVTPEIRKELMHDNGQVRELVKQMWKV